jgi:uncharacterized protein (DUF427 family)
MMTRRIPFGWRFGGQQRPSFAVTPQSGQESVWDYPRPPRPMRDHREVTVKAGDIEVAHTRGSYRVLETASPPTFYLPADDVHSELLERASGRSWCEWKGEATYWAVVTSKGRRDAAGWSYADPLPAFEVIRGFFSFYPERVECYVDAVRVQPQPGPFYGGWMTPELVGPVKGEPGSESW